MSKLKRKRKSKRQKMRRIKAYAARTVFALVLLAVFGFVIFSGIKIIGAFSGLGKSKAIEGNELEIHSDGSLTEITVDSFDTVEYDADGLKKMAEDEITSYNSEKGAENAVKLTGLNFKNGYVTMTIDYASAEDYSDFNSKDLKFAELPDGASALSDISSKISTIDGGKVLTDEDISGLKGHAVIVNDDTTVVTPKKIRYISKNVTPVRSKQATVKSGEKPAAIIY